MKSSPRPLAQLRTLDGAGRSSGAVVISASSSELGIDLMILLTIVNHNFDFLPLMRVSFICNHLHNLRQKYRHVKEFSYYLMSQETVSSMSIINMHSHLQ